ncbi:NEK1 [Symbiodinium sp. CCMP2592]|nr:NEK1 [Symbiodinium sp. CCMP2592]
MEEASTSPHAQTVYDETILINEVRQEDEELLLGRERGYRIEKVIGRGSFGAAYLARDEQQLQRVIKAVEVHRAKAPQSARTEVAVMKCLKHPHIIRFRDSFAEKDLLCIVMDFAPAGDLLLRVDTARRTSKMIAEERTLQWFLQAVAGVKYMHSLCIIHRDIKNENLFLESEEHLRIGDFGLARRLKRATEIFVEQQIVGTPLYLSPEVCAKGMYSTASDVWALGCSLFELCSFSLPFEAANLPSLLVKITGMTVPPRPSGHCSPELADICVWLLTKSRQARPTAVEVFQHPFLRGVADQALRRRPKAVEAVEVAPALEPEDTPGGYPSRTEEGAPRKARVAFGAPGDPQEAVPAAAEVCYERHLALSQSLGGAAGTPQHWLRSLRRSKVKPLDAADVVEEPEEALADRNEPGVSPCAGAAGSPHQWLRKSRSDKAKLPSAAPEDESPESQITLRLAPEVADGEDNTCAILQAEAAAESTRSGKTKRAKKRDVAAIQQIDGDDNLHIVELDLLALGKALATALFNDGKQILFCIGDEDGEQVASLPLEELSDVKALKQRLHHCHGLPTRFRQRLLLDGRTLPDDFKLDAPLDLELLLLSFREVSEEQVQALLAACEKGSIAQVESMLQLPQDPDLGDATGLRPLLKAADRNRFEVAQLLLEAGADPNAGNKIRITALIIAASRGFLDLVRLLLEKGADPEVGQNHDSTPLLTAAAQGQEVSMRILLEAGANKDRQNYDGFTALIIAARLGYLEVVQLLLDWGCNVDLATQDDISPLIGASHSGCTEIVKLLLEAGCNKEARNRDGNTALMMAAMHGHGKVLHELLEAGCDIDVVNKDGKTARMLADIGSHDHCRFKLTVHQRWLDGDVF